ncbi:MAG: aldo/keto reductase [Ilumatobacteraceae bacterium]
MREIGESFVSGPLGLGTQRIDRLDVDGSVELLQTAHELGIQVLDTADIYGEEQGAAERRLGEALGASGLRDRFVVAARPGGVRCRTARRPPTCARRSTARSNGSGSIASTSRSTAPTASPILAKSPTPWCCSTRRP